jgi:carotenoid cleavage dioxygenase-like enzyme
MPAWINMMQAEDDGWVMALVYDSATDRTKLAILDARKLSGELSRLVQASYNHKLTIVVLKIMA